MLIALSLLSGPMLDLDRGGLSLLAGRRTRFSPGVPTLTTGRGGNAGSFDDASMEDMEALLDEDMEFRSLRRGDVLEGIVMETSREGVLVDIGSKSEGIIPLNEMHSLGAEPLSKVKRGDELLVYVLQPESQEGQVILSLDRARGEQGWRTLQKRFEDGDSFEGEVTGFNKGGLLVNVEGVNAFVPLSQVVGVRPDRGDDGGESGLQANVGRMLRLKVIEINRRRNRVILSERAAMQEYRSQQKDRLLSELREGEIRRGRITSVRPFGVFVDLGGADGLAHLSELTWERGRSPEEVYHVGDEVDVFVMKVDPETKKIALSLRRAQPERWDEIVDSYRIGQIVPGKVTKLVTFGAFARVDGPVEGLIHVSELSDRRIQHPREVVREGDIVPLKVLRIERDKHRIALSLRQARDDAERQGWEFDGNGSVIAFPERLRPEIESKLGVTPDRTTGGRDEEVEEDQADTAPVDQVPRVPAAAEQMRPPPAPAASVVQEQPPAVTSAFEALRGFRSEADERRAAEEAAAAAAPPGAMSDAEAESDAPAEESVPHMQGEPGESIAGTPEGSITSPPDGTGEGPEPPPEGERRPEASAHTVEEKAERSP
jgi:small subunit ribosomal protein S1